MKNIISFIFISLFLSGCFATTAKYEEALDSWVGHTEDHLVTKWGVPNGVYEKNDGGKILYATTMNISALIDTNFFLNFSDFKDSGLILVRLFFTAKLPTGVNDLLLFLPIRLIGFETTATTS